MKQGRRWWHVWRQAPAGGAVDEWPPYDPRPGLRYEFAPRAVLTVAMLGYAVFYGWWSLRKYDAFQAAGFDLGIFAQGLWLLSRLKAPFVTLMGLDLFGDHTSYILLALVPLYRLVPHPETLLVVQTFALALGALPVFLLARLVVRDSWFALVPAVAYLLMPALGWLNLENFHPDSFEVPLVLFALYFVARARWRPYLVMVLLLLTVKEDFALVVVPLGIYVALRRNWKVGALTVGVAAVWFPLAFLVLQPLLSGTTAGGLDMWRIPFGGFGGVLRTFVTAPWTVIAYMFTGAKLKYLLELFAPLLFLPLLTARTLMVAPVLAFNLISTFYYQTNLHYHYTSLVIPVLTVAAILSLDRFDLQKVRRWAVVLVLLATCVSAYLWGPLPGSRAAGSLTDPKDPQAVAAAEAVALIPPHAVVASRDKFASHLTSRDSVYVFPTPFAANSWGDESLRGDRLPLADAVEYVLEIPDRLTPMADAAWAKLPAEGFVEIFDKEGVVLLKRESAPSGGG